MWGARVVVPPQDRDEVMNILHSSYLGMVRMKGIPRSHVWWPKMDQALERRPRAGCQRQQSYTPLEGLGRPRTRIYIDYAGLLMGKIFLIIIDAHTK